MAAAGCHTPMLLPARLGSPILGLQCWCGVPQEPARPWGDIAVPGQMEGSSNPPLPHAGQSGRRLMPGKERTDCRQLWLCWHQPLRDPRRGTLSNTPQLPGLQQKNKTQTCSQSWGKNILKKAQNAATAKLTSGKALPAPPSDPKVAPAGGSPPPPKQGVSTRRGDGHSPHGTDPAPRWCGRAASPLLTLLGSAGRAGRASSWTLGSRHERQPGASGGSCWLPRGGSLTSLFLSEKCNHFLTWALGECKAARRPPCPCLPACLPASQASPPSPHVDGPPAPGCSRQPPLLGGMRVTRPGCTREGCGQESGGEGAPSSPSGCRRVVRPPVPDAFRGDECSRGALPAGAGPQQAIAAVGALLGRDVRQHHLPLLGRFAAQQDPAVPGSGHPEQQLLLVPASH